MTIIASLHAIQCEGPSACCCEPIWVRERPVSGGAAGYNGVHADDAGDSSAATNAIDSVIPPAGQLSPGSVGGLRTIEGIVR